MSKTRLLSLLSLLFAVTLFTGCKDDEPNPEKTRRELLTEKDWRGDKILALGMDASTIPQLAGTLPDIKSMVLDFNSDGTYTATYTESGQTVPLSGTWEFRNEEKAIHFDLLTSFSLPDQVDIKTLSSTNLALTTVYTPTGSSTAIPLEVQFVHD